MNESFLQFIWKTGLFERINIKACTGELISVVNTGQQNFDSGPDFFNARIKINNIEWAGNIEIHTRASDWNKHKHNSDEAYNNVILQVVAEYDTDVFNSLKNKIPTIILKYNNKLLDNYMEFYNAKTNIACKSKLHNIDIKLIKLFLNSLLVERLEQKVLTINQSLKNNNNNWEETFYLFIANTFGGRVNNQPFKMLAENLPLKILAKQKNNLLQTEALLFGQSGLLPKLSEHQYVKTLIAEYAFLKSKYNLTPLPKSIWKFLRVRPLNFPSVRIAQFAGLIYKSNSLFSKLTEQTDFKKLSQFFNLQASEYWDTHYNFNVTSPNKPKILGMQTINSILINTVIPFIFLYGKEKNSDKFTDRAIKFLEQIEPEKNKIISEFEYCNIIPESAFESQALIQLYNNYCINRSCLKCNIGIKLINITKNII